MSKVTKAPQEMTRKHLRRAEREARQRLYLYLGLGVVAMVVLGLIGFGILNEQVLKPRQPVAQINGQSITTADFQKRYRYARTQLLAQYSQLQQQREQFASDPTLSFFTEQIDQQLGSVETQLSSPATLGGQIINAMVEEELIRQEAAKRNISIPAQDVQTAIEHDFDFYRVPPTVTPTPTASPTPAASQTPTPTPTQSITPTGTPEPTSTPYPTSTPVTEQSFNTQYANYLSQLAQTGMTKEDFQKLVEASLLRDKLGQEFGKTVQTTAEQLQFKYLAFETEQSAQDAQAQLKGGTSFDDVYGRVQAGQIVSASAGLEPWSPMDELEQTLSPSLAEAIKSLTISQTSQIVTDTYSSGYFIFRQEGREVRPLTESQLQSRQQQAFQDWLSTQRGGAGVNLFNSRYLDAIPTN